MTEHQSRLQGPGSAAELKWMRGEEVVKISVKGE
jgi:hypothetical protein